MIHGISPPFLLPSSSPTLPLLPPTSSHPPFPPRPPISPPSPLLPPLHDSWTHYPDKHFTLLQHSQAASFTAPDGYLFNFNPQLAERHQDIQEDFCNLVDKWLEKVFNYMKQLSDVELEKEGDETDPLDAAFGVGLQLPEDKLRRFASLLEGVADQRADNFPQQFLQFSSFWPRVRMLFWDKKNSDKVSLDQFEGVTCNYRRTNRTPTVPSTSSTVFEFWHPESRVKTQKS